MKNHDFKISINAIWILLILSIVLILMGVIGHNLQYEFASHLLIIGISFFIPVWFIIMNDILKQRVYNKPFWITSMLFMSTIASVLYLIRRKKLIKFEID